MCSGPFGNVYLIKNLLDKNIISGRNLCDKPQINFYNVKFDFAEKFNSIKVFFLKKKSNYEKSLVLQLGKHFMGTHLTVDTNIYEKRTNLFKIIIEIKNKLLHKLKLKSFYYFYFYFNSLNNKYNYVDLSNKKDLFGLYKINIVYQINIKIFKIYIRLIQKFLKKKISLSLKDFKKKVVIGNHPCACNSMGRYSNSSTVDKNLKIHKYSNIYVIGSDVFKQSGITNPALTIMTLGYKLAVELKKKYKNS